MSNATIEQNPADALKAALANNAEGFVRWLFPAGHRTGVNYLVGSLRGEAGKSLVICVAGPKTGVYKDFATDDSGDNLLELLRMARGYSFADACREAKEWTGLPPSSVRAQKRITAPPRPEERPYQLTDAQIRYGLNMAERLIASPKSCEAIGRRRGWRCDTVSAMAAEASLGLSEKKRLVFLYDTGCKERWWENGEKQLVYLFGKGDAFWRGGLLPIATRVFIAEGETDAISLVDAGAEQDENTLVVALPSSTTIKPWWGRQLAGKSVVLCMDADPSGRTATEKLKRLLAPHVSSLQTVNMEALLK